jgi:hypothetical protein
VFCRAVLGVTVGVCGISEAKLLTVVRIRFTAAVIRAESAASLMWAACNSAGKLLIGVLNQTLDLLQRIRARVGLVRVVERLQKSKVFAGFRRNILDSKRFRGTELFAGLQRRHQRGEVQSHLREYRQTCQRHADPLGVASRGINEMLNTAASMILLNEFTFISAFLLD